MTKDQKELWIRLIINLGITSYGGHYRIMVTFGVERMSYKWVPWELIRMGYDLMDYLQDSHWKWWWEPIDLHSRLGVYVIFHNDSVTLLMKPPIMCASVCNYKDHSCYIPHVPGFVIITAFYLKKKVAA